MRIAESRIRRIIREEAASVLRNVNEAAFPEELEAVYGTGRPEDWEDAEREAHDEPVRHDDGRWFMGENGIDFEGDPELEGAWSRFVSALGELGGLDNGIAYESPKNSGFRENEMTVAEAAAEQVQMILFGR